MTAARHESPHSALTIIPRPRLRDRIARIGGPTTQLWELPDAGHTGGLRTHPAEYERPTTASLDRALGLKETS